MNAIVKLVLLGVMVVLGPFLGVALVMWMHQWESTKNMEGMFWGLSQSIGLGLIFLPLLASLLGVSLGGTLHLVGVPVGLGMVLGGGFPIMAIRVSLGVSPKLADWIFEQCRPLLEGSAQEGAQAWAVATSPYPWSQCPHVRCWVINNIDAEVLSHIASSAKHVKLVELFRALVYEGEIRKAEKMFNHHREKMEDRISPELGQKLIRTQSLELRKAGLRSLGKPVE